MRDRKCTYCGGPIPPKKRADSMYCHNTCKAKHWEEKKGKNKAIELKPAVKKEQPNPERDSPLEGLRGVVEYKPKTDGLPMKKTAVEQQITPTDTLQPIKMETQAYKDALAKKEKTANDLSRVENVLLQCRNNIAELENEKAKIKPKTTKKIDSAWHSDTHLGNDYWDEFGESAMIDSKKSEIDEEISSINKTKAELDKMLPLAKKAFDEAQKKLNSVPQYEPESKSYFSDNIKKWLQTKKTDEAPIPSEEINNQPEETESSPAQPEEPDAITDSRILSAQQLKEMKIETLDFKGRWREFFGLPASIFHLAVHGNPGEGKSTFCLQFANYLAENHGKVIYISGEEGFSPTITKKLNDINVHKNLFITNYKKMDEIKTHIRKIYHFIFIDSLDNMGIDPEGLRGLREHFPNSSFITISQSTKNGSMRGSQEIAHDCDIVAKVEKRIAMTTKNRFHKTGFLFDVCPADKKINVPNNKIEKHKMGTLRNVI
jgi:hypothetical protein